MNRQRDGMPSYTFTLPPEVVEAIAQRAAAILEDRVEDRASPWLTLPAAADYLGWPRDAIYKLTSSGAIPHRKVGNRLAFHRGELDEWLDEHRRGRPAPRPRRLRAA